MQKVGRNDPCPCGSGKKFKKCCESKMIGGRFLATKIEASPSKGLSSLFRTHVSEGSSSPASSKTFKVTQAPEKKEKSPEVLPEDRDPDGNS